MRPLPSDPDRIQRSSRRQIDRDARQPIDHESPRLIDRRTSRSSDHEKSDGGTDSADVAYPEKWIEVHEF